jgi:hypothetical protein
VHVGEVDTLNVDIRYPEIVIGSAPHEARGSNPRRARLSMVMLVQGAMVMNIKTGPSSWSTSSFLSESRRLLDTAALRS